MLRSLYYYRTTHNDNNIKHRFFSRSYSDLRFPPLPIAIVFVRYCHRRNKKIKIKSKTFIKYDRTREFISPTYTMLMADKKSNSYKI